MISLGRQKTAPPKIDGEDAATEMDRIVKDKIVSADIKKRWINAETALERTPRGESNMKKTWTDARDDESNELSSSYHSSSQDESSDGSVDTSCDSSQDCSLSRCGTSWETEVQQENMTFQGSVKSINQVLVRVTKHGNTENLMVEVSKQCNYTFTPPCIASSL